MTKRPSQRPVTPKQVAKLSADEMRQEIVKLERRISELKALDIQNITTGDQPELIALKASIESTLESVFGATTDYDRYEDATKLDLTPYALFLFRGDSSTPPHELRKGITEGRNRAVALLQQARNVLAEKLGDLGETRGGRALRAYEGLDLHPEIERAADALYRGGHYSNAVADAVKALNGLVRMRSGKEIDGTTLMETVFSVNNPILKFNDAADQSDKDEQRGFMMMFSGAVAGLRNPRAHKFIKDDPERALEFIAFVSLLAKLLDGAKR